MNRQIVSLVAVLLWLPAVGCANFAGWLRQYTYPPGFHYITSEQLRSTMWQLAYHSRELRGMMETPEKTESHRGEILQHLQAMEQAVNELNRTGWPTNHPLVDANRSTFFRDIRSAQEAVSRDPPNFLLAGSVSGACAYCHPSR